MHKKVFANKDQYQKLRMLTLKNAGRGGNWELPVLSNMNLVYQSSYFITHKPQ